MKLFHTQNSNRQLQPSLLAPQPGTKKLRWHLAIEWSVCFLEAVLGFIFLSCQIEFVHTAWWFMFDTNDADLGAILTLIVFAVIVPLFVEYRPLFTFIAKHVSKFQLFAILCLVLNYPRVLPVRARHVLLGLIFSLSNICDFAITFRDIADFRRARQFFGKVGGLLILWLLSFGSHGMNLLFDSTWLHIVGFALAIIALFWFSSEEHRLRNEFRFSDTEKPIQGYDAINGSSDSSTNSPDQPRTFREKVYHFLSNWFCLAFSWSSLLFITLWMFGSIFVSARWAGIPTNFAPLLILGLVIGCVHLRKVGSLRYQIIGIVAVFLGTILYCHGNVPGLVFAGAFLIALALPVLWRITYSQMNKAAKNGCAGRCLAIGGILFFAYVVFTIIALIGGDTELPLAFELHGNAKAVLWVASVLFIVFHGVFLWLSRFKVGRMMPKDHWNGRLFVVLLVMLVVVAVPCMIYFGVSGGRSKPVIDNERTVITAYNIQEGWSVDGEKNFEDVSHALYSTKSEIVCLPESDTSNWLFGARDVTRYLGYSFGYQQHVGPPSSVQTEGVTLLSNLPVVSETYHLLPTAEVCAKCPLVNRILLESRIRMRNGEEITVFCTHFQYSPAEAYEIQAEYTARVINETAGPVVLLGDLNFHPDEDAYRIINQTRLTSAISRDPATGEFPTTMSGGSSHIDYVLYSEGDFDMETSEIVQNNGVSDHLPVSATFNFK